MWIMKSTVLVVLVIGLCSAATTTAKTKINTKEKEVKGKRDAPNTVSAPYSYEIPQKAFHTPSNVAQPQPKYTHVEHHQQSIQKVAPLEYTKQEVLPVQHAHQHVQQVQQSHHSGEAIQQYHPTTFHNTGGQYPQHPQIAPESQNNLAQAYKAYEDFAFTYPNYEAFNQMPIVHYNGDYDKVTSSIVNIPGYNLNSNQVYSNVKASPSYSFASPANSYVPVPSSYSYPVQSNLHYQSVPQSYGSSPYSYANIYAPANSHHTLSHSSQIPATHFVAQAVEHKPSKVPDYATGSKGLGHYSSNLAIAPMPAHPSNSYIKNTYEVPSYTQTERPFKPSTYLGASHITGGDSYVDQAISSGNKPNYAADYYSVPSKNYLPAKESYQYASQQPQIEYQIQYVQQQQPTKSYVPPVANSYLPTKQIVQEQPKNTYLPPSTIQTPVKNYLPAKLESPVSTYLPPTKSYLPPNAQYRNQGIHHQYQSATPVTQGQHHQYQSATPATRSHHQQFQSHESYDSAEYQSVVSQSGHK